MSDVVGELKQTWSAFKHDPPGERFQNHRVRMKEKSRGFNAAVISVGVVLVLGGAVLLFVPGPGTPLILFGIALAAGPSKVVARTFDRLEPWARRQGRKLRSRWERLRGRRDSRAD